MGFFKKTVSKMTNEKVTLKQRKRMIVFVAVITLLSMVTSTVAWFTVNTFAGVDKLDLHISVSAQLKVAMQDYGTDLSKYGKTITNEMVDQYLRDHGTSLQELILDPVTTSNGTRFVNQRGAEREPNKRSYLEFECYFIATEEMWVHLTSEGSDTIENDEGTKVTSSSPAPKNDVVNCVRVSYTTDSDGTPIYEPNKSGSVNGQNTFDISNPMNYSNETRLFHLEEMKPKKVTIRLWIDGEDPQCDDDVQEAELTVAMSFVGCDETNTPIS